MSAAGGEFAQEFGFVHVVLESFAAVDENHGDFVVVEALELRVGVNVDFGQGEDGAVFDNSAMGQTNDLYSQAVAIVMRDRKASTSYIQRRLQIGYNRAASLMEKMELEGIVGAANHAGKREILVGEPEHAQY